MSALDPPRFVVDVMLGRLARWLRALGYDTFYDPLLEDAALAEQARREDRVLLTRDVELTRRRGLTALLIRDDKLARQLRQVVRELQLDDARAFTRCVECNAELVDLRRSDAAARVPPYVFETQDYFRECPSCHRVYWRGTHWEHMRRALRDMEQHDAG